MTEDFVKLLADAPIYFVLIYLLIKENAKTQQLLTSMIEREAQHAKDILELACHGIIQATEKVVPVTGEPRPVISTGKAWIEGDSIQPLP